MIFPQAQKHWIINDPTLIVSDQNILALTDRAFGQIPRREQIGKFKAIRAGDLYLTLYTYIPDRHIVDQVPIFGFQIAIINRKQHMVVNRVAPGAVALGSRKIRCPAQPGAPLHEAHVKFICHACSPR